MAWTQHLLLLRIMQSLKCQCFVPWPLQAKLLFQADGQMLSSFQASDCVLSFSSPSISGTACQPHVLSKCASVMLVPEWRPTVDVNFLDYGARPAQLASESVCDIMTPTKL